MNVLVEYSSEYALDLLNKFGKIIYKSKFKNFIYLELNKDVCISRIYDIPGVISVEEKSLQVI